MPDRGGPGRAHGGEHERASRFDGLRHRNCNRLSTNRTGIAPRRDRQTNAGVRHVYCAGWLRSTSRGLSARNRPGSCRTEGLSFCAGGAHLKCARGAAINTNPIRPTYSNENKSTMLSMIVLLRPRSRGPDVGRDYPLPLRRCRLSCHEPFARPGRGEGMQNASEWELPLTARQGKKNGDAVLEERAFMRRARKYIQCSRNPRSDQGTPRNISHILYAYNSSPSNNHLRIEF